MRQLTQLAVFRLAGITRPQTDQKLLGLGFISLDAGWLILDESQKGIEAHETYTPGGVPVTLDGSTLYRWLEPVGLSWQNTRIDCRPGQTRYRTACARFR